MGTILNGWDFYDPNDHDATDNAEYRAARTGARYRAERRRATYGAALSALRHARSLTQVAVAQEMGVAQGEVSRIEGQTDLLLSTLIRYVEAIDGTLTFSVTFRDGESIDLSVIFEDSLNGLAN